MNNEKTKKQLSEDDLIRPCTEDIWSFPYIEEDNAENREAVQSILKRQKHDEVQAELERLAGGYEFTLAKRNWYVDTDVCIVLTQWTNWHDLDSRTLRKNTITMPTKQQLKGLMLPPGWMIARVFHCQSILD